MTPQDYMRRAISLAEKGAGFTNPNPMVGAVIVKNDKIIGEGYHEKCGELHAERNALASVTEDPKGATMYVTLEPCCHTGRTPPCTEAVIAAGIAKVVIGSRDPNPKVAGKGAKILREHGIEVVEDFLRDECDALNPVFFHYIKTGLPFAVMKYAMTADGKIAAYTGLSQWITGESARQYVHRMRGRYAAILAGIKTVLADDPMLNCRAKGAHQPLRIIVDSSLKIPLTSQIVQTAKAYPTMVACAEKTEGNAKADALAKQGVEVVSLPDQTGRVDLNALMRHLGDKGIDSVLIEGGGTINEAALKAGIVTHVCAFIAPKLLGGRDAKTPVEGVGFASPDEAVLLGAPSVKRFDDDILLEYDMRRSSCLPE